MSAVTRAEALRFNSRWTDADRALINEQIDRLQPVEFHRPPKGGYITCRDSSGRPLMHIEAGMLTFPESTLPANAIRWEPVWTAGYLPLSTKGSDSSRSQAAERTGSVCPDCFEVRSLAGDCSCTS